MQILGTGAAETIINASGSNNRVLTLSDLGGATLIAGLKLTGGNPSGPGGGVHMTRCGGLTFSGVSVTNNTSNSGTRGMGIYSESCVLTMTDCLIADNRSSASGGGGKMGGGIYLLCAHALIAETVITNNRMTPSFSTTGDGGGVCQDAGTLILRNVLLTGNDGSDVGNATGRGDGVNLYQVGTMTLENCTIADNLGQGVRRDLSGTMTVRNAILWGNGDDVVGTVALRYANVEDGDQVGVDGNIQAEPQFVDAASRNYRLKRSSTSINAGEYQMWMAGATDLDGSPRVQNKIVDLGAYETYLPLGGTTILVR